MRYLSIELINYAGIYNGMGLNQIKIDFTKCKSNKVIIRGSNGSGKSTLMSAISPNPDSNDKFIPNQEARKNIVLFDNGIQYIIRYIHPVSNNGVRGTTKGYIAKVVDGNPVELNPNGNISSCRDIIYDEFTLDANFITLAQLSSEDRGLVDRKPAERKKLLNNIISVLETYNTIYKTLTKKSSIYKATINSLVSKIDYIGDEVKVTAQLNNIESRLRTLEEEKETTIEAIAAVKLKIHEYTEILENNKYDEIVTELSTVTRMVKSSWSSIEKILNQFNIESVERLQEFSAYLDQQIIIIESEISNERNKIPILLNDREQEFKTLQAKEEKLKSMNSDTKGSELAVALVQFKSIVEECESVFEEMGLKNIKLITKEEFDSAIEALKYLKELANNLTQAYDIEFIIRDINDRQGVVNDINSIPSIKDKIKTLSDKKSDLSITIAIYRSKREIAKDLINRPEKCTIDDCPYIASAVKADREYSQEALISMENEYSNIENELNNLEVKLLNASISAEVRQLVGTIERELKSKIRFIKKLPIRNDFEQTFMQRVISLDPFHDIDKLYKYIDCGNMIEEYKVAKEHYNKYSSELEIYQAKIDIMESLSDDIRAISKKTEELASQVDDVNALIHEKEIKLTNIKASKESIKSILDKYNEIYLPNKGREEELLKIKQSLDLNTIQINTLRAQLDQLNKNMGGVNSDIKNLSEQRDALKHSLILLNDYKAELQVYSDKYSKIEVLRHHASPNSGIQSVYIGNYMNKILYTANELLGLLFGGEFTLLPFVVNETEFRIPAIGSGLSHDDISSMSAAQKSMISMIISFALLHQSSTKYNIINVDEIDGQLDNYNRGYFITLLDKLMNLLHCEQAFVITHNSELDSSLADLIILKSPSNEVYNGNIIWKYE